ncbi:sulfate permease [Trichoderma citrinoviride]|uniref:Sulfate permease n=1 Tax=Trichoderma citrinoviride TaxID=58853 RepID=A0A2T4BCV8_9HYPO|nr:sulfate permease [Trichoderma citrinoviride]PTB67167.1 sulfate permease [Trichoderma citrinoviride]
MSGTSRGTSTTSGYTLARVLGIKFQEHDEDAHQHEDPFAGGESMFSNLTSRNSLDRPPTASEWLHDQLPSQADAVGYLKSLFPCISWLPHYNLQWLAGDVVAGITAGAVLVPQGMAYASLANLPPQYGLYSSFVGPLTYWIFGTSKDISLGPVAVLSTVVGTVVADLGVTNGDIPPNVVATGFSIMAGSLVLVFGTFRLGWLVDLISITSLSAFMTGSAITIGASQLPSLFGITSFSNRDAAYRVIVNTLKHLNEAKLDATLGLTALLFLYLIRYTLTKAAERWPNNKRVIFFLNTMRTVFVILLYTMVSWVINKGREEPVIRVLGVVPKGFESIGVPPLPSTIVSRLCSHLPAAVIVMIVEHIAISKSFGRVNNYTVDPSQEMVAIGMANLLGTLFGAYSSTGSFSRTAIQSKAGVRTPASGLVSASVVLLATYLLTDAFYYIPNAVLAAVIIHAVGDLITPPSTLYQFWRVSPLEVFIFFIGVFLSIFSQIEDGLYATVCISAVVLLYRILKARGRFLGQVKVHSVLGDHVIGDNHRQLVGHYGTFEERSEIAARNIYLPLDHDDGSNSEVELGHPYPGIFIYRFSEGLNYPSANFALEYLTNYVYSNTRRTSPETFERRGDRPWSSPGQQRPGKLREEPSHEQKPTLKAIILDFSSVNNADITSVQRLIDVRNVLDVYAAPGVVDWHFACINNRWTRRALAAGGFGTPTMPRDGVPHRWKSIFSVAEIGGKDSAAAVAEANTLKQDPSAMAQRPLDEETVEAVAVVESWEDDDEGPTPGSQAKGLGKSPQHAHGRKGAIISGLAHPLFHVDLTSAVQSAIANVEARLEAKSSL